MRHEYRSEVSIKTLYELGIFEEFFNPAMRSLIRSIMPDANLLTFQCYENAGGQTLYSTKDHNIEWHRDVESLVNLQNDDPNYLSIFIYLSKVTETSGAFEIRPVTPTVPLNNSDTSIRVVGKIGTSFIWNRMYYHRQAINESPERRRIFKLSIQHNYLGNDCILSDTFKEILARINPNDSFVRYLLGEWYLFSIRGKLLPEVNNQSLNARTFTINNQVDIKRFWRSPRKFKAKVRQAIKKYFF